MLLYQTHIDFFYRSHGSKLQVLFNGFQCVEFAGSWQFTFSTWIQITYFLLHVDREMFPLCWNVLLTASFDRLLKAYKYNPL